jgi:hypothetical protein
VRAARIKRLIAIIVGLMDWMLTMRKAFSLCCALKEARAVREEVIFL